MKSLRIACLFAAAAAAAAGVLAQSAAPLPPPIPANAMPPPIPENATPPPVSAKSARPPPPPAEVYGEPDLEPQITIIRKDAETVEEIRVNGELRYVRVTPRGGKTYYLVPSGNGRNLTRYDSLGSNLSVPMWLLFSW